MESTKIDFVLESVEGESAGESADKPAGKSTDIDGNRAGAWGDKPAKKHKKAHKHHG